MSERKPRTFFARPEGGVHLRIWFAKAGKNSKEEGISPLPEQHFANGTYSFSLTDFNPIGLTQEQAVESGKEGSLFKGYGAQFGAQVWRMAHEAKVGDYIFLESENHHLHAVGYVSGSYSRMAEDEAITPESMAKQGIHRIPVHWVPIANGQDLIQLGRLDNAVFRNIAEKEELAELLWDVTHVINHEAWGKPLGKSDVPPEAMSKQMRPVGPIRLFNPNARSAAPSKPAPTTAMPSKPVAASTGAAKPVQAAPSAASQPAPKAAVPVGTPASEVVFKISRNGQIVLEVAAARLSAMVSAGAVLPTDHCWTNGMSGWLLVSQQLAGGAAPRPAAGASVAGKVLDFNVTASSGLILADDGVRYTFRGAEWRSAASLPLAGLRVNFVVNGLDALAIYAEAGTPPRLSSPSAPTSSGTEAGFYRSSDAKLVGGVCAGLAHKWDIPVLIPRIACCTPLFLVYAIMWLTLPEKSTKR
jgi:phage shock protein PspC (stress-responsive transcriptional regulator)